MKSTNGSACAHKINQCLSSGLYQALPVTNNNSDHESVPSGLRKNRSAGLTLIELLSVMAIGTVLALLAIPVFNSAMTSMRLNAMANNLSAAIGKTRYRAIMNSQVYTLTLNTPGNTYVVTNAQTTVADNAVPLPSKLVAINGGATAAYTFTFCPNGTVYGAGGVCPSANLTPALSLTHQSKQTNISVSSVGNVTTTPVH